MTTAVTGTPLFPAEERRARLTRHQAHLAKDGLDVQVVDETELLHCLTGFATSTTRFRCLLVSTAGDPSWSCANCAW